MMVISVKLRKIGQLFNRIGLIARLNYRGIRIAGGVTLDILGGFRYGHRCIIGKNAILNIPKNGKLTLGTDCYIGRYVEIGAGNTITIGNHSSIQDRCVLLGDIAIGDNCLFSYNVYISSGRHYFDFKPWLPIKQQDKLVAEDKTLAAAHSRPVLIEDDCFIGINAVIMPGIIIGKGAVIGANSVVTKNVAPYSIVAGSPAREINKRLEFSPPKAIDSAIEQDLPYFYSGFNSHQTSTADGMQARHFFTIFLNTEEISSVHLLIKTAQAVQLRLNDSYSVDIAKEMSEVVFHINETIDNKLCFSIFPENAAANFLIQKAWVA
jgi:acetyltransferase-like isoleucine patch superfamily enzyme